MKTFICFSVLLLIFICGCKKDDNSVTNPSSQQNTVTDIDGNIYHTVKIGTQTWTVENLKVTKYRNGEAIPNITDVDQWRSNRSGAYCSYDNSVGNSAAYGYLYNYYVVTNSKNIAPSGWHVPSDIEWMTLISTLGSESIVGGNLKEAGTSHWSSPNTGADNSSGFTALPGGYRRYNPNSSESVYFSGIGEDGYWWTTTNVYNIPDNFYMKIRNLSYTNRSIGTVTYLAMPSGCSIRLVKD